jgi:FKBP-type peptidyl-prolyl cis-trans isomerase
VNMQAGEVIDMECPSYFANGGNEKYGHFGSSTIPANSDLFYQLEVLECEGSINSLNDKN